MGQETNLAIRSPNGRKAGWNLFAWGGTGELVCGHRRSRGSVGERLGNRAVTIPRRQA